jgi:isopentenyl diphosphate isomerase/L-lactate dehydrogenase-like FMN-dependent dehydrogenase
MTKVAPIDQRKADHIKINLEQDVRSALTSGLEKYHFIHEALPELDLNRIDTSLSLFGKQLTSPTLISSMTGGTSEAETINLRLAEAAQECGIAMGVGHSAPPLNTLNKHRHFKSAVWRQTFYCLPTSALCNLTTAMAWTNAAKPWI